MNERVRNRFEESCHISMLAVDQYRCEVAWIETEPLTEEEETRLLQLVQRGKVERSRLYPNQEVLSDALHARDRLIEAYQPLVMRAAQRYCHCVANLELLDLIQEGNMGLLRVLDQDNLLEKANRRGFLYETLRYTILSVVRECDGIVRLPRNVLIALSKMRKARSMVAERIGRCPTPAQIASAIQISEQDVSRLQHWERCTHVLSLNVVLCEQDAEDWVPVKSLYEMSPSQLQGCWQERSRVLAHAMETLLTSRQREIIRLRYGFEGNGLGQRKVAQLLGALGSSIYQSERVAKEKLRQALEPVMAQGGAQ